MIEHEILEKSFSAFVIPLTVLQTDGQPVGICLEVQRINKMMMPVRARTAPIHEILQSFRGTKYVVCLKRSVNGTRKQTKQKMQTN
jgi:hypothetical protein